VTIKGVLGTYGWCEFQSPAGESSTAVPSLLQELFGVGAWVRPSRDLKTYDKSEAPLLSMSARVGTGDQPLHTDAAYLHLPPRYIALHCLDPGEGNCPTRVLSVDLFRLRSEGPAWLREPHWICCDGYNSAFYSPITEVQNGIERLRFDPFCMFALKPDRPDLNQALAAIEERSVEVSVRWDAGRCLIIDNWRCLHARGTGAIDTPSRLLRRWYCGG
jgi:hypothetical protein